jgi:hypothetical protein
MVANFSLVTTGVSINVRDGEDIAFPLSVPLLDLVVEETKMRP